MIDFLVKWIEQIAIAVIISSIFELILPSGNMKKYIKIILGIYIIFNIISPAINNKLYDFSIEDFIEQKLAETSEETSDKEKKSNLEEIYVEELKQNIESKLKEENYKIEECNIDANFTDNNKEKGIKSIFLRVKNTENKVEKVEIGENDTKQENNEKEEDLERIIADYYELDIDKIDVKIT